MKLLYYLPQVYLLNKSRAFRTCWWLPSWRAAFWSLHWWRTATWPGILVPLKMWVVLKYESYYRDYCTLFCKLILKHFPIPYFRKWFLRKLFFFESVKCGNFHIKPNSRMYPFSEKLLLIFLALLGRARALCAWRGKKIEDNHLELLLLTSF